MSFQAYLDTIERTTGQSPADLRHFAEQRGWTVGGVLQPDVKAAAVVAALKQQFALGHGHAMAVFALLKGTSREREQ